MDLVDIRDACAYIPKEIMNNHVIEKQRRAFEVF